MATLKELRSLVTDDARRAFENALLNVAPRQLFGFCLYSDDSATTLVHTVGIRDGNCPTIQDEEYWNPHEWEEFGGLLNDASQSLLQTSNDYLLKYYEAVSPSDGEYDDFRNGVFDTIVSSLAELRSEGIFGTGESQIYLCFSVSQWSENDVLPWVQALNPQSTALAYTRAMDIEQ